MLYNDAYSRWSTGNRGRATSTSEVIEVAGSNHAIGVTLKLAWGPSNFSPSVNWSWQCFCCLFYFSPLYHHFMSSFFPSISEQLYSWVTLIFFEYGLGI